MRKDELVPIEFFGGPFDGYVEHVPSDATLPSDSVLLISDAMFQLVEGRNREASSTPTSVAIYESKLRNQRRSYAFVASISLEMWEELLSRTEK